MLTLLTQRASLPYEGGKTSYQPAGALAGAILLAALTILEILAFTLGLPFSALAAYIWFALGAFAFCYLCWSYITALLSDLLRGALWGLLPLVAAVPLCFFFIDSYTFINTESLSELEDTYARFQEPDRAYTAVFWATYPARSLVLNLIPTALFGISPWSYRAGFSYPIFFGVLFFFTGIRRYHLRQPKAAAVASLVTTSIFTFPMFCQISRTFEMAISSVSFGMWAIGALLIFAAQPTVVTAIVAAWTIGLLAASFTSGLGLVALLWLLLGMWAIRAYRRGDTAVLYLVSTVLLYCIVVGIALYLVRPYTLRLKQISLSEMVSNFYGAIEYTISFSRPVFTSRAMVIPVLLTALFALSLRGGWLSLMLIGWCFPVIWSATNFHGKIGPQLPFALYRSLIIIPVILYVMARMLFWMMSFLQRFPWFARLFVLVLAVGLYSPIMAAFRSNEVFSTPRQLEGREVILYDVLKAVERNGLSPLSDGWIADRTDEKRVEHYIACFKYFLLNWKRIERNHPIPSEATETRKPGVIVAMPEDPIASQDFPGYHTERITISTTSHHRANVTLTALILRPH